MFTIRADFGVLSARTQEHAWDHILNGSRAFCLLREAVHRTSPVRGVPHMLYVVRSDPRIDEVGDRVIDQIERMEASASKSSAFAFCDRINIHPCGDSGYRRLVATTGRWSFPAVSAWYRTWLWGRIPNLHATYITVFSGMCRYASRDFLSSFGRTGD